jgi:hypothetical protein
MERDCIRRAAAYCQPVLLDLHGGELAGEAHDQRIDAGVRCENVRAETDRNDTNTFGRRPTQQLSELADRLGSCQPAGRAPDPHGGQPSERDGIVDVDAYRSVDT